MSLVEEKTQLGFGLVADLRQLLEEFGEQPELERGVKARAANQFAGSEYIDIATPVLIGPKEVLQRERWLTEKLVAALVLQDQQRTLDCSDRRFGYVAVAGGELRGMIRDVAKHRPEILEIEHEQALLVRDPKINVEHALLNVIQVHQPRADRFQISWHGRDDPARRTNPRTQLGTDRARS